jgi:uncharacterized protein YukE
MSAPVIDAADDLSGLLSDIEDAITAAEATMGFIDASIRSVLDQLPGWLVDGIRAGLAELQRTFIEKMVEIRGWMAHRGNPGALRGWGAAWRDEIGAAASRAASFSLLNGVSADDHWTGAAADAYRNTLPAQQAAAVALKTAADEVDAALNELANAIATFWGAIGIAMVSLGVGLISAGLSLGSGPAAPIGLGIAVTALSLFAGASTAAMSALIDISNDAATRSAELERRISNDVAFPAGAWPRSTTPISADGSTTDGDDTDWHVK